MSTDARFTAAAPTRPLWLRLLLGFIAVLVIAALAVAISSLSGRGNQQTMHPGSVSPDGAGALGAILSDQGVETTVVHTVGEALASGGTIVVWDPQLLLTEAERQRLLAADRLVVISEDGRDAEQWLGESLRTYSGSANAAIAPSCAQSWLTGIDTAEGITVGVAGDGCFPIGDGSHVIVAGSMTYFASPELFVNENLAKGDNAAIAIRAIGQSGSAVWLMPKAEAPDQPSTVPPALTGALIGFILVALWHGVLVRRPFGPLIPEQLPVVVPSAEAARGRARLYERSGDAAHAGAALRAGIIAHHAGRLGLPPDATADMVVGRIAAVTGRPRDGVHHLLYGPGPASDSELTALATDLTDLSKELTDD